MFPRLLLVLLLLVSVVGLTPLAYADPPDPVWIPGVWDDDDQDDAIILATSGYHGITTSWVEVGRPPLILVATIAPSDARSLPGADLGPAQSRAPPVA